jgi:hypothetical protein
LLFGFGLFSRLSERSPISAAMVFVSVVMIAGCEPSGVRMRRESVDWQQEKVMVQRSLERFDEGVFYVYEWRPGIPPAIVADLKDPDRDQSAHWKE